MRKVPGKGLRYNTSEQLVLPRKVVIDHRFGNAGFFGYLKGGGAVEPLRGEQQRGRLDDVLFFVGSKTGHGRLFVMVSNGQDRCTFSDY